MAVLVALKQAAIIRI